MNYHHNPLDTESNTYAKAILQGGYSPPSTEPLYEVPKYTQEELEQPKSSSTGMSKAYQLNTSNIYISCMYLVLNTVLF